MVFFYLKTFSILILHFFLKWKTDKHHHRTLFGVPELQFQTFCAKFHLSYCVFSFNRQQRICYSDTALWKVSTLFLNSNIIILDNEKVAILIKQKWTFQCHQLAISEKWKICFESA